MKLFRTYVGGSKKNETKIFDDVCNDVDNMNWVEYKRIFNIFSIDLDIILKARIYLTSIIYKILIILALFLSLINPFFSLIFVLLSVVFYFYYQYLKKYLMKTNILNKFTFNVINREIYNQYNKRNG